MRSPPCQLVWRRLHNPSAPAAAPPTPGATQRWLRGCSSGGRPGARHWPAACGSARPPVTTGPSLWRIGYSAGQRPRKSSCWRCSESSEGTSRCLSWCHPPSRSQSGVWLPRLGPLHLSWFCFDSRCRVGPVGLGPSGSVSLLVSVLISVSSWACMPATMGEGRSKTRARDLSALSFFDPLTPPPPFLPEPGQEIALWGAKLPKDAPKMFGPLGARALKRCTVGPHSFV